MNGLIVWNVVVKFTEVSNCDKFSPLCNPWAMIVTSDVW
jgi:hypothetical protein